MSPVASHVLASARLFCNGWADVDATGLAFSQPLCLANIEDLVADPDSNGKELLARIQHLLLEMHAVQEDHAAIHRKLDSYWVAALLLATRSPLLQVLPWQRFVLPPEMIFDIKHVIDIGPYAGTTYASHVRRAQAGRRARCRAVPQGGVTAKCAVQRRIFPGCLSS